MRFLRTLTNAVLAGAVASAYLTVLVLQLNPAIPLTPGAVLPLAAMLGLAYGANLAVAFYALVVLRQLLSAEVLSPGWLSVRLLSWLLAAAATGAAVVTWLNVGGFEAVLDEETSRRLVTGAVALSAAAVLFVLLALAHLGRRGGRASAALLIVLIGLSIAVPLGARGPARTAGPVPVPVPRAVVEAARPDGRVTLLLLDGASLDVIAPAAAAGQLPNFGRILDAGAVVHLATLRPTQPEPVWSAVATGRTPMANGVRSSGRYRPRPGGAPVDLLPDYCFAQALVRFGFLTEEAHTAASLTARPLWRILGDMGVPSGTIGWPLTSPAPEVRGFLVSDMFHRLSDAELDLEGENSVWPPDRLAEARRALATPVIPDPLAIAALPVAAARAEETRRDPEPLLADRMHLQVLRAFEAQPDLRVIAARFPGVDAVGHYFLRYQNPTPFGDVSDAERRQYGDVLERYYGFLDGIVGQALEGQGPDDLLLVVSGFGMEPLSPGKRLLEQLVGNPAISGTHEPAPDGFLLAYGPAVAAARPPRGSVLDVVPTVLYYLGLPVGRDMDGVARTDLFRPAFTAAHPITFIPSYGR
ncbi:MAG: alkaline phosphatase family protein [Vicinamibacterales bacterium]